MSNPNEGQPILPPPPMPPPMASPIRGEDQRIFNVPDIKNDGATSSQIDPERVAEIRRQRRLASASMVEKLDIEHARRLGQNFFDSVIKNWVVAQNPHITNYLSLDGLPWDSKNDDSTIETRLNHIDVRLRFMRSENPTSYVSYDYHGNILAGNNKRLTTDSAEFMLRREPVRHVVAGKEVKPYLIESKFNPPDHSTRQFSFSQPIDSYFEARMSPVLRPVHIGDGFNSVIGKNNEEPIDKFNINPDTLIDSNNGLSGFPMIPTQKAITPIGSVEFIGDEYPTINGKEQFIFLKNGIRANSRLVFAPLDYRDRDPGEPVLWLDSNGEIHPRTRHVSGKIVGLSLNFHGMTRVYCGQGDPSDMFNYETFSHHLDIGELFPTALKNYIYLNRVHILAAEAHREESFKNQEIGNIAQAIVGAVSNTLEGLRQRQMFEGQQ